MSEPTSHRLLEPERYASVERDHLPRVARYMTTYDNKSSGETRHVLYWNGLVQSMEAAAWLTQRGALPNEPTQQESDAAVLALQQATQQAQADAAALRQRVLNTLQTAVGVPFDSLNNAQLKAVVEALAWKAGALNNDTTVRPLADWLK